MPFLPDYKDILDLIKKGSTIEAQEKIMALREGALALQEENTKLKTRIGELEARLSEKEGLLWEPPFYWMKKGDSKDGPFCQKCYDSEGKLIRLQNVEKGAWSCKACNNNFFEESYKPPGIRIRSRIP
jgi:hypothetical protein